MPVVKAHVTLAKGITAYSGYGTPDVHRVSSHYCMVEGTINANSRRRWGALATLPAICRPHKELIFQVSNSKVDSRLDVLVSGEMKWVAGGHHDGLLSFSGIAFTPGSTGHLTLQLATGFSPYSSLTHGWPAYVLKGFVCSLEGAVTSTNYHSHAMSTLPAECRPTKRLMFCVWGGTGAARVDVWKNGHIFWVGGHSKTFVSLSGVSFGVNAKLQHSLPLVKLKAFGFDYGTPTYMVLSGRCVVEGLASYTGTLSSGTVLGNLPAACRPQKSLVFSTSHHDTPLRLDVKTNGQVSWAGGTMVHKWVSFTGIAFSTKVTR